MIASSQAGPATRPLSAELATPWGQRLRTAIERRCRMERAVRAIGAAVGSHIGARSTFDRLLTIQSVTSLSQKDRFRSWLLLTTICVDPAGFGLSNRDVPSGYDIGRLTNELRRLRDIRPNAANLPARE